MSENKTNKCVAGFHANELTLNELELVDGAGWWDDATDWVEEAWEDTKDWVGGAAEDIQEFVEDNPKTVGLIAGAVEEVVRYIVTSGGSGNSNSDPYSYTPAVGLGSGY